MRGEKQESFNGDASLALEQFRSHFLPVAKVPSDTVAQQLAAASTRCAELKAELIRKDIAICEALMWLSVLDPIRAQEALNKAIINS